MVKNAADDSSLLCGIVTNSTLRLLTLQNHYIFAHCQIQQKSWLNKPTFIFLHREKALEPHPEPFRRASLFCTFQFIFFIAFSSYLLVFTYTTNLFYLGTSSLSPDQDQIL